MFEFMIYCVCFYCGEFMKIDLLLLIKDLTVLSSSLVMTKATSNHDLLCLFLLRRIYVDRSSSY